MMGTGTSAIGDSLLRDWGRTGAVTQWRKEGSFCYPSRSSKAKVIVFD